MSRIFSEVRVAYPGISGWKIAPLATASKKPEIDFKLLKLLALRIDLS
jgi:hypothetical protein